MNECCACAKNLDPIIGEVLMTDSLQLGSGYLALIFNSRRLIIADAIRMEGVEFHLCGDCLDEFKQDQKTFLKRNFFRDHLKSIGYIVTRELETTENKWKNVNQRK